MRQRVAAHLRKMALVADEQGRLFRAADTVEVSWVIDDRWASHQRLELETDLIAAHVLRLGQPPSAQFLGR